MSDDKTPLVLLEEWQVTLYVEPGLRQPVPDRLRGLVDQALATMLQQVLASLPPQTEPLRLLVTQSGGGISPVTS